LIGGEQRAQHPAVHLGVEDRESEAVWVEAVGVSVRDAGDEPVGPEAAQGAGVVDDGFDSQRPPVPEVLLDSRVPLEGVDIDLGAAGGPRGRVCGAGRRRR
jgi:hypothetical protein